MRPRAPPINLNRSISHRIPDLTTRTHRPHNIRCSLPYLNISPPEIQLYEILHSSTHPAKTIGGKRDPRDSRPLGFKSPATQHRLLLHHRRIKWSTTEQPRRRRAGESRRGEKEKTTGEENGGEEQQLRKYTLDFELRGTSTCQSTATTTKF